MRKLQKLLRIQNSVWTILVLLLNLPVHLFSQNVGIGTTEPYNKLQVNGSFVVTTPTIGTNSAPAVAQTKTMVNATTVSFVVSDSTGRIYDPGGPAGNYNANITAYADIPTNFVNTGIEVIAETMALGAGDSLIFKNPNSGSILLAVGNNYNSIGKWIFPDPAISITFKSNADASTGAGFSLLFRKLYDNSSQLPAVSGYAGSGIVFDAKAGSFQSGFNNNAPGRYSIAGGGFSTASGFSSVSMGYVTTSSGASSIATGAFSIASGNRSTAMGESTIASGENSTAMGSYTTASNNGATSMGSSTTASGINSTAMGTGTDATALSSTAMGHSTTASGDYSTAMGRNTTASGLNSTAMGNNASTNNQTNSLAIGGTGAATVCNSPNQFMARFDNYTFFVTPSSYAYLIPSSNGWAYTSDKNKKEKFEELDGETVLTKMAGIPLYSWNFKDSKPYRHYGIMAQDFYNAFGKDSYGTIGNDTTVSSLDLIGVAYSAIKALEKRSTMQQAANEQLKRENLALQKANLLLQDNNLAVQKKIEQLELKLNGLLAIKQKEEAGKTIIALNK